MVRVVEARVPPRGRFRMPGGLHELGEIPIAHLVNRHLKSVYPNAMRGSFLVAPLLASHHEFARGNQGAGGLGERPGTLVQLAATQLDVQRGHAESLSLPETIGPGKKPEIASCRCC